MKILYVPNEWGSARQSGVRKALATLVDQGFIEAVRIHSLLWRVRQGEGKRAVSGLIEAVKAFSPDMILMQHLGGTGVDDCFFSELRSTGSFALIYHEADPYSRWRHPLPGEAQAAGRHADVVYTVGKDVFRSNFTRTGSSDVRWCSSVYDPVRFGQTGIPTAPTRDFDVVMIANRGQARTPFTGHPNSLERVELVGRLAKKFGPRFAVYGKGWTGVGAQGPIDYSQQHAAIHAGWITANWDHYASEAAYFSDRLPTTLATGSVHVTTAHRGFDDIFPSSGGFIHFGSSPKEIVTVIEDLLSSRSPNELVEGALEGQRFADKNFRQDDQLVQILNFDRMIVDPVRARASWEKGIRMLVEL